MVSSVEVRYNDNYKNFTIKRKDLQSIEYTRNPETKSSSITIILLEKGFAVIDANERDDRMYLN